MSASAKASVEALMEADSAVNTSLGLSLVDVAEGAVELCMTVRADMVNSHGVCHGGYLFALADTAFAYCLASLGNPPVTLQASICFLSAARAGDCVTAKAVVTRSGRKAGFAQVELALQDGRKVASFQASGVR